jgi:hypothetical protein
LVRPFLLNSNRGFKSLKQSIKILAKNQRFDEIYPLYKSLLQYTKAKDISKNDADKAINNVLNQISSEKANQKVIEQIYKVTLDKLLSENNEVGQFFFLLLEIMVQHSIKVWRRSITN